MAQTTASAPARGEAVKRSIPRVIIFSILSPFYGLYWFYQTRSLITRYLGGNDQVGLQTVGLIVPILNLFIVYWLLRDIDKFNRQNGGQGFPALWFVLGPVILAIIPFVNLLAPIVWLVLFVIVLQRLNEALDKKGATEAPYTTGEIVTVVAGVLFWIFYFAVMGATLLFLGDNGNELQELDTSEFTY